MDSTFMTFSFRFHLSKYSFNDNFQDLVKIFCQLCFSPTTMDEMRVYGSFGISFVYMRKKQGP